MCFIYRVGLEYDKDFLFSAPHFSGKLMNLLLKYKYLCVFVVLGLSFCHFAFRLNQPPVAVWDEVLQVPAGRSLWTFDKARYTHTENPPLGKAIIGLSIRAFGDERWVHRLPSAISAAAISALLFLLILQMTENFFAALLASGLWMTSSMGYLHARLGTLDMMTCFFFVAGFFAFLQTSFTASLRSRVAWLLAACALTALGGMVKVIVLLLFPLILIGLVLRRKDWALKNSLPWFAAGAALFSMLVFFGIYACFGYSPPQALEELRFIYNFHHHDVSHHQSLSSWWQWLLLRGNFFYLKTPLANGDWVMVLCAANPVLWILGEVSILTILLLAVRRREVNAILIALAVFFQLAFWIFLKHRTLLYYSLPIEPFFCLGIAGFFSLIFKNKPQGMQLFWLALLLIISSMGFYKYFPYAFRSI